MTQEQENEFKRVIKTQSLAMLSLQNFSIELHSLNLTASKFVATIMDSSIAVNAELAELGRLPVGDSASAEKIKEIQSALQSVITKKISKTSQFLRDMNAKTETLLERYHAEMEAVRQKLLPPD